MNDNLIGIAGGIGMLVLRILIVLSATAIGCGAQYLYAIRGYPNSKRWKAVLFFTGTIASFSLMSLFPELLSSDVDMRGLDMVIIVLVSILGGFMFAWLLPYKVKRVIPKR